MLHSLNIKTTLIGHSERRAFFLESDEIVFEKISQALKHKIKIILCVGENKKERNEGNEGEMMKE